MDPLTHTLVGANLAVCARARRVQLAGPALVIGANLPDLDVLSYFGGGDFALGFRRGWTHGWPALIVLPVLLWAALMLWARARATGRCSPPRIGSASRLLFLCYLAVLTHPCLDWLNTYGMRWLMPLDGTWYYGDSVFIIDPWLWLLLGGTWLLRRRPAGARLAIGGLAVAALYIGALVGLHAVTEDRVQTALTGRLQEPIRDLMVGPRPANPLLWDVVVHSGETYRLGHYSWLGAELDLDRTFTDARADPRWPTIEAAAAEQAPGFLRWVRYPWLEIENHAGSELEVFVMDARYVRRRTTGFGGARVVIAH